jgi:hypothetical protein
MVSASAEAATAVVLAMNVVHGLREGQFFGMNGISHLAGKSRKRRGYHVRGELESVSVVDGLVASVRLRLRLRLILIWDRVVFNHFILLSGRAFVLAFIIFEYLAFLEVVGTGLFELLLKLLVDLFWGLHVYEINLLVLSERDMRMWCALEYFAH